MLCTIIVTIFLLYACLIGIQILRFWDISSGEEQQLLLEKKTYLISSILYYVMLCEIFSLFLFVFIAEDGHELFIGAMCAAGTLNVNDYGYPTLLVRLISFILCGVWIVVNYIDNNGYDYPLIKFKQIFLFGITLLIIFEGFLQFNYLLRLEPEIITSCCGTIFSDETGNVAGEIIRLPVLQTEIVFYLVTILTVLTGGYFLYTGKQALLFSCLSFALLIVGLTAILSFIAVYYYEEPTHHCPFACLKKNIFISVTLFMRHSL